MARTATIVKAIADQNAAQSPKFSMPIARAPRMTVKFSHDKKVRSFAKKTLGSTRVGRAIRLPVTFNVSRQVAICKPGQEDSRVVVWVCLVLLRTRCCLEKRLAGHCDD